MSSPGSVGENSSARFRALLDVVTTIAMLCVAIVLLWAHFRSDQKSTPGRSFVLPKSPVSLVGAPTRGSISARGALIIFSDFQCPFCGEFARKVLPSLDAEYVRSDRLLIAFRNLPLGMHQFAEGAAEAAQCAKRQGKFWELHDVLFANQDSLARPELVARAVGIGVDLNAFEACMNGDASLQVRQDVAEADALGIRVTPFFLLGSIQGDSVKVTKMISGAKPLPDFRAAVEEIIR